MSQVCLLSLKAKKSHRPIHADHRTINNSGGLEQGNKESARALRLPCGTAYYQALDEPAIYRPLHELQVVRHSVLTGARSEIVSPGHWKLDVDTAERRNSIESLPVAGSRLTC